MKKRILTLVLSLIFVLGSFNIVLAGYAEGIGEFTPYSQCTAFYYAECNYSDGNASTQLYVDSSVIAATSEVSMDLYIIDSYFYENLDPSLWDSQKIFYDSDSVSENEINNRRVFAELEITGADYIFNGREFQGYRVESEHYATITYSNDSDSVSGSLVADY